MRVPDAIMNKKDTLVLTWKHPCTRQRYLIGLLAYQSGNYIFQYLRDPELLDVDAAVNTGLFKPLVALPDIRKRYESRDLFYPFAVRLPAGTNGIHALRITGGRLATDDLEFLEIPERNGVVEVSFFVMGWKYYEGNNCQLQIQQEVVLLGESNTYDPHAIRVLTTDSHMLGYVPAMYCRRLDEYVKSNDYYAMIECLCPIDGCRVSATAGMNGF